MEKNRTHWQIKHDQIHYRYEIDTSNCDNIPELEKILIPHLLAALARRHKTLLNPTVKDGCVIGVLAITKTHPDYEESIRFTPECESWKIGDPHPKWIKPPRWLLDQDELAAAQKILEEHQPSSQFETIDDCLSVIIPPNPDFNPTLEEEWLTNGCGTDAFAIEFSQTPADDGTGEYRGFIIPHPLEHVAIQRLAQVFKKIDHPGSRLMP